MYWLCTVVKCWHVNAFDRPSICPISTFLETSFYSLKVFKPQIFWSFKGQDFCDEEKHVNGFVPPYVCLSVKLHNDTRQRRHLSPIATISFGCMILFTKRFFAIFPYKIVYFNIFYFYHEHQWLTTRTTTTKTTIKKFY